MNVFQKDFDSEKFYGKSFSPHAGETELRWNSARAETLEN